MSKQLHSISVTSPTQILNHPLNTSTSKVQYSFAKENRFKDPKINCNQAYYDLKTTFSKRSTGMGFGKRSSLNQSVQCAPPPGSYHQISDFDYKQSKTRGKSFGLSREKVIDKSYIPKQQRYNPGPGYYDVNNFLKSKGFSMRPKTPDVYNPIFLDGKASFLYTPGPGQYQNQSLINKIGKQAVSKYQSSKAATFNPPQSQRFAQIKKSTPGPGSYDLAYEMKQVLSTVKNQGSRVFSHSVRGAFTDEFASKSFTPGPGNYRIPSDFGHYETVRLNNSFNKKKYKSIAS